MSPTGSNRTGGPGPAPGRPEGSFRAHARRAVRTRVLVTHVQAGWRIDAPVENIGLGGARVLLGDNPLAPGDAVTLSFPSAASAPPLLLQARIAWIASGGAGGVARPAGVAFEHTGTEAVFSLYQLLSAISPEA